MTRQKIKAGVIGCGAIAQACHIPGYIKNPKTELIAIADISKKNLNEAGKNFGIKRHYLNYHKMLENEELDAVSICGPNNLRLEMIKAAAEKGVHIFCEKPMCCTLEEAQKIKEVLKKNKVKMMIGFTHRLLSGNIKAREIIRKGEIGHPFMMRIRFANMGPYIDWQAKSNWFYNPSKAGGGVLLDTGIHAIDLCKYFMGHISQVSAHVATLFKNTKVDNNALIILNFADKGMGCIEVSWTSPPGFTGIEIYGRKGAIIVDYSSGLYLISEKLSPGRNRFKKRKVISNPAKGGWSIEIDHFINGLKGDRDFKGMNWQDGFDSLKVALVAYESARKGKRIAVNVSRNN